MRNKPVAMCNRCGAKPQLLEIVFIVLLLRVLLFFLSVLPLESHRFDFGHENIRQFGFLDRPDHLAVLKQNPLPASSGDAKTPSS